MRINELINNNTILGDFSFNHLKLIHLYIFQDIYPFAGKIRKVNISKGNMFCNVNYIDNQAKLIFNKLKEDNYLNNLKIETFIKKLAYYFSKINTLHPFREGNGRTQREFIRQLCIKNGYAIDYSTIKKRRNDFS